MSPVSPAPRERRIQMTGALVFTVSAGTGKLLTLYLIEMPFKALANRADPAQAAVLCVLNEI